MTEYAAEYYVEELLKDHDIIATWYQTEDGWIASADLEQWQLWKLGQAEKPPIAERGVITVSTAAPDCKCEVIVADD